MQHLKKSYSLSDLTGEKEDENRNTSHMHDETDMEGSCPTVAPPVRADNDPDGFISFHRGPFRDDCTELLEIKARDGSELGYGTVGRFLSLETCEE